MLLQEELYSESVEIDHRVHSRIIGGRGRGVRRITEDFNVDLRFPGRDASNPNLVVITGDEDAVLDCKDHLLELEDEYVRSYSSLSGQVVIVKYSVTTCLENLNCQLTGNCPGKTLSVTSHLGQCRGFVSY